MGISTCPNPHIYQSKLNVLDNFSQSQVRSKPLSRALISDNHYLFSINDMASTMEIPYMCQHNQYPVSYGKKATSWAISSAETVLVPLYGKLPSSPYFCKIKHMNDWQRELAPSILSLPVGFLYSRVVIIKNISSDTEYYSKILSGLFAASTSSSKPRQTMPPIPARTSKAAVFCLITW